MTALIYGGVGFLVGWLAFKRPDLMTNMFNWLKEKVTALWDKVF